MEYGFTQQAINSDAIPNPGFERKQVGLTGILSGVSAGAMAFVGATWPLHMPIVAMTGPFLVGALVAGGVILNMPVKKNATALAVEEFGDTGLSPEVIGSVIVEGRISAHIILSYKSQWRYIQKSVNKIGDEVLAIINGFKDDPSDVLRCRHMMKQCLDQSMKILRNLEVIERRIAEDNSVTQDNNQEVIDEARKGLEKIAAALVEQHQRNLDNNQTALEIDVAVSEHVI